ncbi:MAG: DNA-processing protein DprA [Oscillatoriaceae bacterium SKW80]|nr:DNA-processing protein DprA [Oscillatoriaceae bacterium SKYG93]MCX8119509.1 DNA-processing protein DprA [Oscillatoriaceae bacterium SKW80]MDW8454976.1 DNA-processing protein DprA [Oscillatoriaceae cyanobacterium SKYGB_i_bin93]HIK28245.1 DNA-protecting protein DprA [Oscillatoriaceae cyanobacterium M7585_C2015_266]
MTEERAYWLAWSQINGIGPVLIRRLHLHFGSLAAAWYASPAALRQVEGFGSQIVEKAVRGRAQLDPESFFQNHLQKNPHFFSPADPEYPRLLLEIPNPPPVLYYRGQINLLENQGITKVVGIVGTRKPSEYGIRWTRRISGLLAKSGFTIVSGMAAGIDTEAHRGCLDVGGRTLAILGTPLDKVYPESNYRLYQRILEQGAAFSEYPYGSITKPENFPQRNRIIAGLSRALLVMEAPARSGALISARLANEFCRDVYALPGRVDDYNSQGCLQLVKNGAEVIVNEEQLLEMLKAIPPLDLPQQLSIFDTTFDTASNAATPRLSSRKKEEELCTAAVPPRKSEQTSEELAPELARVLQAVTLEAVSFDAIALQSGLSTTEVSSALLQLELLGLVSQLPGMRYQRC